MSFITFYVQKEIPGFIYWIWQNCFYLFSFIGLPKLLSEPRSISSEQKHFIRSEITKPEQNTFILLSFAFRSKKKESKQKQRQWFPTTKHNYSSNEGTVTTEWPCAVLGQTTGRPQHHDWDFTGEWRTSVQFHSPPTALCDWTTLAGGLRCVNSERKVL